MPDEFDSAKPPAWLLAIAVRVDELIAEPGRLERFQKMLAKWKAEQGARGPNGVELLPRRRLSIATKFALLAAIHDEVCEKTKRIGLWGGDRPIRRGGLFKLKAGISFTVLCSRVGELQEDADRARIEQCLRDVEKDLGVGHRLVAVPSPADDSAGEHRRAAPAVNISLHQNVTFEGTRAQEPEDPERKPRTDPPVKDNRETAPQQERKRRGRKPDTDPKADKRVAEAWATGQYKTLADLASAMKTSRDDVKWAIDRHRKRRNKGRR